MPTKREREYYQMGFHDGMRSAQQRPRVGYDPDVIPAMIGLGMETEYAFRESQPKRRRRPQKPKKKRTTLSAWQKFVKANSKKKEFRIRGKKLNFKKLGIAYRKKTGKRKGKK